MAMFQARAVAGLGLLTAAALAQQDGLQRQVLAKERQELDCLKSGNYAEFASLLADDAVFVDTHGPAGKADIVRNAAGVRLSRYTMEDMRFVRLSARSALLIYKLTETGTSRGREFTATVYVSALWGERGGKWICLYSQETPVK